MKAQSVTINMELLGAHFANMDSVEQGAFFRGLAKELSHWESNYRKEMQFSYIASELKEAEKKELETVLTMLWFKNEKLLEAPDVS